MREVTITIESPPDVAVRIVRKEAPSRLRVSPRSRIGKPVTAFLAAFAASSKDGATAPAEAVRGAFEATYPANGKNRREAIEKAWRRALALVEDGFTVENSGGVEVFRKIEPAPISRPPASSVPTLSATRGARTTGRGGRPNPLVEKGNPGGTPP